MWALGLEVHSGNLIITLDKSKTMLSGTDNIHWEYSHIFPIFGLNVGNIL